MLTAKYSYEGPGTVNFEVVSLAGWLGANCGVRKVKEGDRRAICWQPHWVPGRGASNNPLAVGGQMDAVSALWLARIANRTN